MQYDVNNLHAYIPSLHKRSLTNAIGQPLKEVERFFSTDLSSALLLFLQRYPERSLFFSQNVGGTQFHFGDNLAHSFAAYPGEFSVILLPEKASSNCFGSLYRLSEAEDLATETLKECIGSVCEDVRIWKFQDDLDPGELAMEAGVSYLLSNKRELFYCIYLHGDYDADHLVLKSDIQLESVAGCFSLKHDRWLASEEWQDG